MCRNSKYWQVEQKSEAKVIVVVVMMVVAVLVVVTSAKGGYVFTSVCLSVCLSVRRITEKGVNGF